LARIFVDFTDFVGGGQFGCGKSVGEGPDYRAVETGLGAEKIRYWFFVPSIKSVKSAEIRANPWLALHHGTTYHP
jgi:hypothetical protein